MRCQQLGVIFGVLILSAMGPLRLDAQSSAPGPTYSLLLQATIECLVDAAVARDTVRNVELPGNRIADSFVSMTARRAAIRRFQGCQTRFNGLTAASDAAQTGLDAMRFGFDSLLAGFQRSLKLDEKLLKLNTVDELRAVVPEASAISDSIDAAWRVLPVAVVAVCDGMVDDSRVSATNTVNRLRLTRVQITDANKLLHDVFPKAAKQQRGDRHVVDASAALMMQFFDQKWLAADEP